MIDTDRHLDTPASERYLATWLAVQASPQAHRAYDALQVIAWRTLHGPLGVSPWLPALAPWTLDEYEAVEAQPMEEAWVED